MENQKPRCNWCLHDPIDIEYHDTEWGVPVHDDRLLFEMINLEGAQAGLSWFTILKKRAHYKKLFSDFDAKKIAKYSDEKLEKILLDPGIVRNRLKVYGVRKNALAFIKIVESHGSFDNYIWQFVNHKPIINSHKTMSTVPTETDISKLMSKDLKKRGFTFVGSTICYAYMQATGMVNDHMTDCFRYEEVSKI